MSDKKHWIIKIVPALAFLAGLIMASVGSIMIISSSLKLELFEHAPYDYVDHESCRYDYNKKAEDGVSNYVRTDMEISDCLKQRQNQNRLRFEANEKQDIVDGVSMALVGFILLLFFRKRGNK